MDYQLNKVDISISSSVPAEGRRRREVLDGNIFKLRFLGSRPANFTLNNSFIIKNHRNSLYLSIIFLRIRA